MKSLAELQAIREKMKAHLANRENTENDIRVVVGMATCGIAAGARPVLTSLMEEVQNKGLSNVKISQTGCIGMCKYEPIVEVYMPGKEKVTYVHMDEKKAREVVASHLVLGKPVADYLFKQGE